MSEKEPRASGRQRGREAGRERERGEGRGARGGGRGGGSDVRKQNLQNLEQATILLARPVRS